MPRSLQTLRVKYKLASYCTLQKWFAQSHLMQILSNIVPWDTLVKKAREVLGRAYASKTAAAWWRAPATRGWVTERQLCPHIHSFCPRGAKNVKEQRKHISIKLGWEGQRNPRKSSHECKGLTQVKAAVTTPVPQIFPLMESKGHASEENTFKAY